MGPRSFERLPRLTRWHGQSKRTRLWWRGGTVRNQERPRQPQPSAKAGSCIASKLDTQDERDSAAVSLLGFEVRHDTGESRYGRGHGDIRLWIVKVRRVENIGNLASENHPETFGNSEAL